jgi:uncharacterized protein involved in propanediol utilization
MRLDDCRVRIERLESPSLALGVGFAGARHGEILYGAFSDAEGGQRRGLVGLPCPVFSSRAAFREDPAAEAGRGRRRPPRVRVLPSSKVKARRAAELTLAELGIASGGLLRIRSSVRQGIGLGSSTSDVTAAIRAVAAAFRASLPPEQVARIAARAEVAPDPGMFVSGPVLFDQREGAVLERFAAPLPALEVVGFDSDPGAPALARLSQALARYTGAEVAQLDRLLEKLRRALELQDVAMLGEVALASASLNEPRLPKRCLIEIERLAGATGAAGVQVAHAGTVVGLLFDPRLPGSGERVRRARSLLAQYVPGGSWHFRVGGREAARRRPARSLASALETGIPGRPCLVRR